MNETGEIVGMVDVLKLTYATLEQVRSIPQSPMGVANENNNVITGQHDVHQRERRPGMEQVLAFNG